MKLEVDLGFLKFGDGEVTIQFWEFSPPSMQIANRFNRKPLDFLRSPGIGSILRGVRHSQLPLRCLGFCKTPTLLPKTSEYPPKCVDSC